MMGDMRSCSFCGKPEEEVRRLVQGPRAVICDECVQLCQLMEREEEVFSYTFDRYFTGEATRLVIESAKDEHVVLRIERRGETIARASAEQFFEAFWRLRSAYEKAMKSRSREE